MPVGLKDKLEGLANLGILSASWYMMQRLRQRVLSLSAPFTLHSKHLEFPVLCRPDTSDLTVFWQILVRREYKCLDNLTQAGLIVDCGGNVGYSSAYFLSRFPGSVVVTIEPDPENFALLERNVAPYGSRCRAMHSGVWSHPAGLVLSESDSEDRGYWARQVREVRQDEQPTLVATDVGTILRNSGFERISILKIDIEGAERQVFSSGCGDWLPRVDNIVIELHGDASRSLFGEAIAEEGFAVSECEELTVCQRLAR